MIDRISVDTTTLAAALLAEIKAHCRVTHTRDDALLKTYTAAAIGIAERKCNVDLNPAEYLLTADELGLCRTLPVSGYRPSWPLPRNNVNALTVMQSGDAGAPDITGDFELWSPDYGGNAASYVVAFAGKVLPYSALITIGVGIADPADLAPPFFSLIARLTASQYENREASSELVAESFAEELMGMWRPSA